MSKIFLSHTSIDKPFVRKLSADLRRYGHTVWIDEAEINIGDSLIGKIREGLDSVDYVAVVLSNASINSQWVQKEIEIASNREIDEKKIIVLPLLIENVELPGFLKGKFYGDFSSDAEYSEKLNLLLRSLGDSKTVIEEKPAELLKLITELEEARAIAEKHKKEFEKIQNYTLSSKSEKLQNKIVEENSTNPEYAPINNAYAFELGEVAITIGYLLWVIEKIKRQGSHAVEWLLEIDDKWDMAIRMLEAYSDMVNSAEI
ncbi:toll/interleukin-1 receptor domain-containing protein [Flavobacterium sp. WC2421]|uniref:toll/interleukin-1 receptor domain-containing protein n=1 Tax=Flavobacterium sp. WC2421 TaxID=3234138 RepID=UPI003464F117